MSKRDSQEISFEVPPNRDRTLHALCVNFRAVPLTIPTNPIDRTTRESRRCHTTRKDERSQDRGNDLFLLKRWPSLGAVRTSTLFIGASCLVSYKIGAAF